MPELQFLENTYSVDDYDTVLNSLLKNGHAIPNFCRSGYCHSCLMKCEEGTPLPTAQMGLSENLVEENHFLACQCAVFAPMKVVPPEKEKRTRFTAMVRRKQRLGEQVVAIELDPGHAFAYRAGQYTTLINIDGISADYPIASIHEHDPYMVFHIPDNEHSPLNHYLFHELEEGDGLEIQTALGDNFYRQSQRNETLLLISSDTGLASTSALAREAQLNGHSGAIHLLHISEQIAEQYAKTVTSGLLPSISCHYRKTEGFDIDTPWLTGKIQEISPSEKSHCYISSQHYPQIADAVSAAGLPVKQITPLG